MRRSTLTTSGVLMVERSKATTQITQEFAVPASIVMYGPNRAIVPGSKSLMAEDLADTLLQALTDATNAHIISNARANTPVTNKSHLIEVHNAFHQQTRGWMVKYTSVMPNGTTSYRRRGSVQTAKETQMMKESADRLGKLTELELHHIVCATTAGTKDLKWIGQQVELYRKKLNANPQELKALRMYSGCLQIY